MAVPIKPKPFKKWLMEKGITLQRNEDGCIPASEFDKHNLPMVVACTNCTMTMPIFSCWIDEEDFTFCGDCCGGVE